MANILLNVCYLALCVLVVSACVAIVAMLIFLVIAAFKCRRNDDFCSYEERREGE